MRWRAHAAAVRMTSSSLRGATIRSADLPSSSSFSTGLYQKKSRERRRTTFDSVTTGMSPRSATSLSSGLEERSSTSTLHVRELRSYGIGFDDKAETLANVVESSGHAI